MSEKYITISEVEKIANISVQRTESTENAIERIYHSVQNNGHDAEMDYINGYKAVIVPSTETFYRDNRDIAIIPNVDSKIECNDDLFKIISVETM